VLVALAGQLSPELVQLAYTTVLHGRNELSLAPDDRTGFTMTLLRLLAFAPVIAGSVPPGGMALLGAQTPAKALQAQAAPAAEVAAPVAPSLVQAQTAAETMPRGAAVRSVPLEPSAPKRGAQGAPATGDAARSESKETKQADSLEAQRPSVVSRAAVGEPVRFPPILTGPHWSRIWSCLPVCHVRSRSKASCGPSTAAPGCCACPTSSSLALVRSKSCRPPFVPRSSAT
jgi:DNA polymerase-3 subunit gamma/tau